MKRSSTSPALSSPSVTYETASRFFFRYAALVLILTATLKIIGFFETSPRNTTPDVILNFLTARELMIFSAFLEFSVAAILVFRGNVWIRTFALAYFSMCAAIYQVALASMGDIPCNCLGTLGFIGIGDEAPRILARVILASFWMGILFLITGHRLSMKHAGRQR